MVHSRRARPVRDAIDVTEPYKLIYGVSLDYRSEHVVNGVNPGRSAASERLLTIKLST